MEKFDEKAALTALRAAATEIGERVAQARSMPRDDASRRWVVRHEQLSACRNVAERTGAQIAAQLTTLAEQLTRD